MSLRRTETGHWKGESDGQPVPLPGILFVVPMPERRKYPNPPVVEALCEIYFSKSTWDETVPGRFYDRVRGEFPKKRQRPIHEAEFSFSDTGEATAGVKAQTPWMQFLDSGETRLVQLAKDLLVVNQLRPYPRFEDWEPIIHKQMEIYREIAAPEGVARLGIRYINRVVIPQRSVTMQDYFKIFPTIPPDVGSEHGAFMVRVEFPSRAGNHNVLLTFGSAPSEKEEAAFSLDIYDIWQPGETAGFEKVRDEVRKAHDNVEKVFEGSVTDKLRSLFERA